MENKTILEGTVLSDIKLSEFGSTLFRIVNKTTYTTKEGKTQESTYTGVVTARGQTAQIAVDRFKKGDTVRVEGKLTKKKTAKLDSEGTEIWETWITAYRIDAMTGQQNLAPLPEKLQSTPATIKQNLHYEAVKQPTPVFKKQVNTYEQQQSTTPREIFSDEDPFGDRNGDPLPF